MGPELGFYRVCGLTCFPITQIHISRSLGEKQRETKYLVAAFHYSIVLVSHINEDKVMEVKTLQTLSLKIKKKLHYTLRSMECLNSSKYVDSINKQIKIKYNIELIIHILLNQIIDAFNFLYHLIYSCKLYNKCILNTI